MTICAAVTPRRRRFIDEYLVDMNGAAVAVRAGFSPRSSRAIAHEILTKPDIRAALKARQADVAQRLEIERQDVVAGLLSAVQMARAQHDPAVMVSGLRELAKLLGFYPAESARRGHTAVPVRHMGDVAAMSDAELTALLEGQSRAAI